MKKLFIRCIILIVLFSLMDIIFFNTTYEGKPYNLSEYNKPIKVELKCIDEGDMYWDTYFGPQMIYSLKFRYMNENIKMNNSFASDIIDPGDYAHFNLYKPKNPIFYKPYFEYVYKSTRSD